MGKKPVEKTKEQLEIELAKEKKENLNLIIEKTKLIKQNHRLLQIIVFITKGE